MIADSTRAPGPTAQPDPAFARKILRITAVDNLNLNVLRPPPQGNETL